jgi:hypothetical protein
MRKQTLTSLNTLIIRFRIARIRIQVLLELILLAEILRSIQGKRMSHFKTRHGILMLSFTVHPFDRVNATEAKEMLSTSILWVRKTLRKVP